MTENFSERIENALNDIQKIQLLFRQRYGEECLADKEIEEVLKIAKEEHEEIQQYRVIGTVEEIKEILQIVSEGQDDVDESGISTGLLHTLLEYAEYKKIGPVEEIKKVVRFLSLDNDNRIIEDLELLNKYKFIGTVEECREARERQRAKKPVQGEPFSLIDSVKVGRRWKEVRKTSYGHACPNCGKSVAKLNGEYCSKCGQAIDWSDTP